MVFFLVLFLLILLYGLNKSKFSKFHNDYLNVEQTTAIRGIFAIIILFSHVRNYIDLSKNSYDMLYNNIISHIGQLMVVMFLFYSGYGIYCSYNNKDDYDKTFLKKRFLKTLVHFDVAVFLFLVLDIVLGIKYEANRYIFCWIGWKDIGNSKWFIFDVLALYLLTKIVFVIIRFFKVKNKNLFLVIGSIISTLILIMFLYVTKKNEGAFWYNTILCYPFGILYAHNKPKIDSFFKNIKVITWIFILCVLCALFGVSYMISNSLTFNVAACLFALIIVVFTMKVKLVNSILLKLGELSFSIYIIQRWPMILLSQFGLNLYNRYIFVIVSFVCVFGLAYCFNMLLKYIDKKFFYNN